MYNLLISGFDESWNGDPFQIETSRCVHEYTDDAIEARYGKLDTLAIAELKRLPCIFAYEAFNNLAPKFGSLLDVTVRQGEARIQYSIENVTPFLTAADMDSLRFELDIRKWELNRTHWAVKDVNLARELSTRGITLPAWAGTSAQTVDIGIHVFDVGLSFPGEIRPMVEQVASELERSIGPDRYFYDNNYRAQLARPSLDTLLQDIYRNRSKLVVVFLGSDYQAKDWCGVEFRAIREIILERENRRVMFIKTDDGAVEGVFKTDGYIDARRFMPAELAAFIQQRVSLIG